MAVVPDSRPRLETAAPTWRPSLPLMVGVVVLALAGTMAGVFGGPALGDHESIVALCARNMRLTGDWIVPWFLETPFFRKPPLPYWLVAGTSYLFANDPATGLPVTTMVARLPTGIAAFLTVLLLWRLASNMFGGRAGVVTAVTASSSLFFLLYSPNATVEMLLTFCCVWAYAHFWYAVTARRRSRQFWHMMGFYVALGFGMLAKGPAPLAMVAVPLAVWWYTHRPLEILARRGPRAWRSVLLKFVRDLWPRTVASFTRLWLLPGLVIFLLVFVPWMIAVARQFPDAWNLWNWQYWQRAQGKYLDSRDRSNPLYYIPIVAGLTIPWMFLIFHAMASPWLKAYARYHRPLLYCGLWALIAVVIMSLMDFKKPYYIDPAMPGLLLMIGFIAERFYAWRPPTRIAWVVWWAAVVACLAGLAAGHFWLRREEPDAAIGLTVLAGLAMATVLAAGALYIRGYGWPALAVTAVGSIVAFNVTWYGFGEAIERVDKIAALDRALDQAGVPAEAKIMWMDARPDSRLAFYFGRRPAYMLTPDEIVNRVLDRTAKGAKQKMQEMVADEADRLLGSKEPVYLVVDQRNYELARDFMLQNTGHVIATVDSDPHSTAKDWVVVSNVPASSRPAG